MVVQDTSKWTDREGNTGVTPILYVERVKQALGIGQELKAPPSAKEAYGGHVEGVYLPTSRFPRWMRCPKCGRLYPRSEWSKQDWGHPVCVDPADGHECAGTRLEQVQHVMVHPKGFLADVSWHFLAHKNTLTHDQKQCKIRNKLVFDLDNKELRCEECGARAPFNDKEPQSFGKENEQPWLWEKPVPDEFAADSRAHIRKVNDALVYSPAVESALVIPPESRLRIGTVVDLLYRNANDRASLDAMNEKIAKARTDLQRKTAEAPFRELANKYRCSEEDIKSAWEDIKAGYPYCRGIFSDGKLLEDEHRAFLEEIDAQPDEDFVTHHLGGSLRGFTKGDDLSPILRARARVIKELVKVDRLKEVRVFKGFTRESGTEPVPPDITGDSGWLPAIELYGEGIFFTLDEEMLSQWEQNVDVKTRLEPLKKRFDSSKRKDPKALTPRFLLLHTLSHLLIRQIEAIGGYPAASLSERLYCKSGTEDPMAGILIYTSAPDKSGTLGGLAELSEPRRFLHILSQALDHAAWCSSDPVCGEHEGQGPELLNLAACHACSLVPDTACVYGNVLLDRVFVKGDKGAGIPSLFE
jgi:hypothetical protein